MTDSTLYEEVRTYFDYDPTTGLLTNKCDRGRVRKGSVAGHARIDGYRFVKLGGRGYIAARIIWLWMTGTWPAHEIDHKNMNPSDDRWENLREASRSQNCANKKQYYKPNQFGWRGIKKTRWGFKAVICINQQDVVVGTYSRVEHAALAYDIKARALHGEFARLNFPASAHRDWLLP